MIRIPSSWDPPWRRPDPDCLKRQDPNPRRPQTYCGSACACKKNIQVKKCNMNRLNKLSPHIFAVTSGSPSIISQKYWQYVMFYIVLHGTSIHFTLFWGIAYHATFPVQIRKSTVQICGNFCNFSGGKLRLTK